MGAGDWRKPNRAPTEEESLAHPASKSIATRATVGDGSNGPLLKRGQPGAPATRASARSASSRTAASGSRSPRARTGWACQLPGRRRTPVSARRRSSGSAAREAIPRVVSSAACEITSAPSAWRRERRPAPASRATERRRRTAVWSRGTRRQVARTIISAPRQRSADNSPFPRVSQQALTNSLRTGTISPGSK